MTPLDTSLRRLRASALATERTAQRAILAAWRSTMTRLAPFITTAIAQAIATQSSQPGAAFALASLPAVRALQASLARELPLFGMIAGLATREATGTAVAAAPGLAGRAILAALGTPPPGVVVPNLSVSALFVPNEQAAQIAATIARLAPGMGDAGARAIAEGVLAGKGPREIARDIRKVTNLAPVRALATARESVNRGFRESALATYRANRDVVSGWRWLCARGPRTCAMCFAMDGRVFHVEDRFASHPVCRCTCVPITRDLPGFTSPPLPEPGREAFARLSAAEQRAVLGPGKMALYLAGELDWDALVVDTYSSVYGPGRREAALRELRGAA